MFSGFIDRSRSFFDELDNRVRLYSRKRDGSFSGVTRRRGDYDWRHRNALANSGLQSDGWSFQSTIDSPIQGMAVDPNESNYMDYSMAGYYQPFNPSSSFAPINSQQGSFRSENFGNISPISGDSQSYFLHDYVSQQGDNQVSQTTSNMSVHSNASIQPKIKDGAVIASTGTKRNLVAEIDFGEEKTVDIFISPRFDCPLEALGATNDTSKQLIKQVPFQDNHPFAKAYKVGPNATEIEASTDSEISKIRLVAQETKITVTNATDDNDGWFEAVRFTPQKDALTYFTNAQSGNQGAPYTYNATCRNTCFGNRDYTLGTEWAPNMSSKGGYVTGKLRNLHRYIWANKRVTRECEFKDLPTKLYCGTPASDGTHDTTTNVSANIAFHDWDYDVIWIRIHGRPAPAGTTAGSCCHATNLMVHLIQGVECVFGEQNMLHSYMTNNFTPYGGMESSMTRYSRRKKSYRKKSKRNYKNM